MADEFDPYWQLLGIPPEEQPANHYRLLGVGLFEPEQATVDAAAKRLIGQLQRNATGAEPAIVRRLLGEISNARVCLLTPDKRAAYDKRLQAEVGWETGDGTNVIGETGTELELTGSGVGHGDVSRGAGAGQGPGRSAGSAQDAGRQMDRDDVPAAAGQGSGSGLGSEPSAEHGGGFFADLGLGSDVGSSARRSSSSKPANTANNPAGATGSGKPAAVKPAAGKATPGAGAATAKSGAAGKRRPGAAGKPQGWKPAPWQIAAACGGALLLIALVFIVVASSDNSDDNRQVKTESKPEAPRFGPRSVTGPIDDVTTRSPLGTRPSARLTAERQGDLLLADVRINGLDAGKFLLDTGCTDVVISSEVAEKLSLPTVGHTSLQAPGGKRPAAKHRIESLTLGADSPNAVQFDDKAMLPERAGNWNVLAVDLAPWRDALHLPIAGIIGNDIWYQMPVQWDVAGRSITFYNRHQNAPTQSGGKFLTLLNAAASVGLPCATVSLNHGPEEDYWLLATGASTDVLVRGGNGGGPAENVGTLTLFGQDLPNPETAALTTESAYYDADDARQKGVIGSHILANFILVLDFQNNKYLAQWNKAK